MQTKIIASFQDLFHMHNVDVGQQSMPLGTLFYFFIVPQRKHEKCVCKVVLEATKVTFSPAELQHGTELCTPNAGMSSSEILSCILVRYC